MAFLDDIKADLKEQAIAQADEIFAKYKPQIQALIFMAGAVILTTAFFGAYFGAKSK